MNLLTEIERLERDKRQKRYDLLKLSEWIRESVLPADAEPDAVRAELLNRLARKVEPEAA